MNAQMRKGLGLTMGLGFGIGLTVAGLLVAASDGAPEMPPDEQVRERARALGMMDPTAMPQPAPAPTVVAEREVYLLLVPGTGWAEAGGLLKEAGLLQDETVIQALVKDRGLEKKLVQPGVYRFRPPVTPTQAVDTLEKGPGG